jgi:hypothetical protein
MLNDSYASDDSNVKEQDCLPCRLTGFGTFAFLSYKIAAFTHRGTVTSIIVWISNLGYLYLGINLNALPHLLS